MSTTQGKRARTIRLAAQMWRANRPHQAITTLREAGFTRDEVDRFVRACHRQARRVAVKAGVAR